MKKFDKSIATLQEILKNWSNIHGQVSCESAETLNKVANAYFRQEDFTQSLLWYHPDVAASLYNVGAIDHRRGLYKEAFDFYQQTLTAAKACHGESHEEIALTLCSIGAASEDDNGSNKQLSHATQRIHEESMVLNVLWWKVSDIKEVSKEQDNSECLCLRVCIFAPYNYHSHHYDYQYLLHSLLAFRSHDYQLVPPGKYLQ